MCEGENEQGKSPNILRSSLFPTGSKSQDSAAHQAALPFPTCKGSAAPGSGCTWIALALCCIHVLLLMYILGISSPSSISSPFWLAQMIADRLSPRGGRKERPHLSCPPRFPAVSDGSPRPQAAVPAWEEQTQGATKPPESSSWVLRVPLPESRGCVQVTQRCSWVPQSRQELWQRRPGQKGEAELKVPFTLTGYPSEGSHRLDRGPRPL